MRYLKLYESFGEDTDLAYKIYRNIESYLKTIKFSGFSTTSDTTTTRASNRSFDKEDFNEVFKILNKDCSKFIKELTDKEQYPIFRAAHLYSETEKDIGLYKKESYIRRNGVDTSQVFTKLFDDEFEKKFGYRFRSENAVFACKNPNTLGDYGTPYVFFPIGDYKYTWNPNILDLYGKIQYKDWYLRYHDLDYTYTMEYKRPYRGRGYDEVDSFKNGHWLINDKKYDNPKDVLIDFPNLKEEEYWYSKWLPNITLEDFIKNSKDVALSEIKKIVNGYKLGSLEESYDQELIFTCKEYYLVDVSYYKILMENLGLKS